MPELSIPTLPPEIMSMIWSYAIEDAIEDGPSYFAEHVFCPGRKHTSSRVVMTDPAGHLAHPLLRLLLVSKATKLDVERIFGNAVQPRFLVSWCMCNDSLEAATKFKRVWADHWCPEIPLWYAYGHRRPTASQMMMRR
jgi:hypothetical protein